MPDKVTHAALRGQVQECRGCELYQQATQGVMGAGPTDAALKVLGEQPGDREDRAGEPFVWPAGRLLDRALEEAGIDPASVYRTHAVKHSGSRGRAESSGSTSRRPGCTSRPASPGCSQSWTSCARQALQDWHRCVVTCSPGTGLQNTRDAEGTTR